MQIRYSQHIKKRLELRKIEYSLPQRVLEESEERYLDQEIGHLIATMKVELYDKEGGKKGQPDGSNFELKAWGSPIKSIKEFTGS